MGWLQKWQGAAGDLKREIHALYLANRDPRTPRIAKVLSVCLVAYALSPIDLIPDPIPVLGYLDDLIVLPLGILLVRRLIPPEVLRDCRQRAAQSKEREPRYWVAAAIIVLLWLITFTAIGYWIWRRFA